MPATAEVDRPVVEPRYLWVPDHVSSAAEEAADLAADLGLEPDEEQRLALNAILAERRDGRWSALIAALVAPRQNIKTYLFKVIALADLFLFDTRLVVWTAHDFDVTMESFRELKELIEGHYFLERRVKRITEANGKEAIELMTGQRCRFKARTKTGGRGLTGDRILLDEGFALQKSHMGSLMPTLSAKSMVGNPQLVVASSAGMLTSDVLRAIRDRGRKGDDPGLAYIEWCAAEGQCADPDCLHVFGSEGCLLDDEERWAQANLALDRRISREFVRTERRTLDPVEFSRERMGWWEDPPDGNGEWTAISQDDWLGCLDLEHEAGAQLRYALDVDTNVMGQEWCSIVASDGEHIELVNPPEAGHGTAWVVGAVSARKAVVGEVLIDGAGPAAKLIRPLTKAGIKVQKVSKQDVTTADMHLMDLVAQHRARHIGQPQLDAAVAKAITVDVGDGALRFSRTESPVDISAVRAASLAAWAAGSEQPFFGAWR